MENKKLKKIFENAYAEHTDGLFRFVLYKVSDKEQAMDILQEVYVRFWETLKKEPIDQPRALLYRIARNLVIDWYKKKKSINMQMFQEGDGGEGEVYLDMFASNIPGAEILLEAKIVIEKIQNLEPIYKEALYLRFVEEMTPKEIAEVLGESSNVISVRINRGIKLLKEKMNKN
jgi:RNA polymerase sigma-70 factor (ECF subfamily)